MRILMWFTIGFTAAMALGAYCLSGSFMLILALFALASGAALLFLRDRLCKISSIVLIGLAVGLVWSWGYDRIYLAPLSQYDSTSITGTVTVVDYSYDTKYGVAADGELELDGHTYKVRAYVTHSDPLAPGDQVSGEWELRLTTERSEQGATHHQGKGIYLLVYADKEFTVTAGERDHIRYLAAKLRQKITDLIDSAFPADTIAFARALLLGDTSELTYQEDTAFKISGIRHVVAVSGLHISILFSMILIFSGYRRYLTAFIGIPVLLLFAAVAGFTPSVVRACIMQILVILGLFFDREYDPPTALSFAVLVMLAVSPLTITSVSFQLSVGCLIGIFLFYQKLHDFFCRLVPKTKDPTWIGKVLRWTVTSISITLSAMVVTTPLSAFYFGTVSLVGVLTNLLTLWLVSFVFYGIVLVCLLGLVWSGAANVTAWIFAWPIRYIRWVAQLLSRLPLSALYTCSIYVVLWLAFCYVLLAIFILGRRKHPAIMAACLVVSLCLTIAASWVEPLLDSYRFTALDVGQGQCLIWQSAGKNYMVDCGGDTGEIAADQVAAYLLSQGITSLDGLILTHYDTDHTDGVELLMSRIQVKKLYLPDIPDDGECRIMLTQRYNDRIVWVAETMVLEHGDSKISLYSALGETANNEGCLCVLFHKEKCDILITGDRSIAGERTLLATSDLPDVDVLVVGHHGSKYSTSLELLHTTKPEVAVISVSADNSHGHPSDEVINRLEMFGCSIWRTDMDRTIIIRG